MAERDALLAQYEAEVNEFCFQRGLENPIEAAKSHALVHRFDENLLGSEYQRYWAQENGRVDDVELAWHVRQVWTNLVGYVVLDQETIDEIANILKDGNKVLEVCCGTGAMAKCLNDAGFEVIATDNFSWNFPSRWQNIENLDAVEAVHKYGKDVDYILISWPNYNSPVAYDVLMAMREVNPNCKLIYIGEDWGGCTANDEFFESVNRLYDDGETIKNFDGIHDYIMICY